VPSPVVPRPVDAHRNRLLDALPSTEYSRLESELTPVTLAVRDAVYDRDKPIEAVYFPLDAVISMVATVEGDPAVEVATIGCEGMAGLPAFLGATTSPNECFCQVSGTALRLSVDGLRRFLATDGALHDLLHRYTQASLVQFAQNVACNRLHTSEERCARWLLQTRDRVQSDTFELTQEFLGQMLGVRRSTVSLIAGQLQEAGIIQYSRGRITILDRAALHEAACECYDIVQTEFDRLISG
jgi:CRP-like cAMP-binding protein